MKKRKVLLSRETLRSLESGESFRVAGQVATQVVTCPTACNSGCITCTVCTTKTRVLC
jgi:hypothetical protein